MRKIMVLAVFLFLLITAAQAQVKTLATVGSEKVTVADFKERLEELPPQFKGYYSSEQGKQKFLDQLVQERILYLAAKKKGVENETEVKEAIGRARKNIIVAYYVNKTLKNVVVDDKELRDSYTANKSKYMAPARVRASHILVDDIKQANDVLAKLNKGADFEALAKERSKDPNAKQTADVGWFEKGQMVEQFETTAFAMNVGDISDPVQTQYGYHIIMVTDKVPAKQKDFNEVKATIREELLREAQNKHLDKIVAKLKAKTKVNVNQENLAAF